MSRRLFPLFFSLGAAIAPLQGQAPPAAAAAVPLKDCGFELTVGFTDQSASNAPERAKGLSVRGGWDLAGTGPFRLQAQAGFQRNADAATTRNTILAGLHGTLWSPTGAAHGMAAVEWRAESFRGPGTDDSTVGRGWVRLGLGYRGLLIPFLGGHFLEGSRFFVPFTRVTVGFAFTGPNGSTASESHRANRDVALEIGFRLFLDQDHVGRK